jgi:photosystem II stability/assembly factor-like uncharacterized protein
MSTVRLLVGTKKAGFVYTSDENREHWELSEPILPGWSIFNAVADLRGDQPHYYLAANHWAWGPSVAKSTDLVEWDYRNEGLAFPEGFRSPSAGGRGGMPGEWDMAAPGTIGNVWSIALGHPTQPGVVFAGTQPAGLFRSADFGQSWRPVEGINSHENRQYWTGTGSGDSCIHSIQVDPREPKRIFLCVGAGGSYWSEDDGESWELFSHNAIATGPGAKQRLAAFAAQTGGEAAGALPPDKDPAGLDELHHMEIDEKNPDRIWGMAHWGVFRSTDRGANWTDVTEGLPSFHGFPIAVTRREPDAVFVVPLDLGRDNFRVTGQGFSVYRTRDSGESWERLNNGLPESNSYQSVYREGLDTDGLDQEGVYVGTSNGQVFASNDGGDHWQRLPGDLPPVLSVTAAVIE